MGNLVEKERQSMIAEKKFKATRNNRGSVPGKASDEWRTPLKVIRAIERHLGVQFIADMAATRDNALCPIYFTKEDDTLTMPMEAIVDRLLASITNPLPAVHALWCNPPYGSTGLEPWIDRAAEVSLLTGLPWIMLLPASRSEQPWFHSRPAEDMNLTYLKERVDYLRADGLPGGRPNHPSHVVTFPGRNPRIAGGRFSHLAWKAA